MKDKTWTFRTLRMMLDWYETYRIVLKLSPDQAMGRTLETYGDFYEVLTEEDSSAGGRVNE